MFDKIGKSKFMKFVLFITTFAFVGTGIVAILMYKIFGGISGAVAVNGREITFAEINFRVNQIRAGLEAQGIAQNTRKFEKEVLRIALQQAINDELLYQEAEKEGIIATDEEVKRYILNIENFKKDGKFSKEKYIQFLQEFGLSSQTFENFVKKKISINHLQLFLILGNYITDEEIKALTFLRNAIVYGKVLVIKAPDIEVSEEELKNFYEKNKEKFKVREGKRIVLYKIDIKKLGKEEATKKAKEVYTNLKENKVINDNSVEKIFEGIFKGNLELPDTVKEKIKQLKDEKNILFVKTDKGIYIGKYLGVGYSYKNFEDIKNNLKEIVLSKKRKKLVDELYNKIEKVYRKKSLEEISKEFNGTIETFQNEDINSLTLKYSINPIQLEKNFSRGRQLLKLDDKVIVLEIEEIKFPSENLEALANLKPLMESMKQGTILRMYLDKLKKDADIEINSMLKEKIK